MVEGDCKIRAASSCPSARVRGRQGWSCVCQGSRIRCRRSSNDGGGLSRPGPETMEPRPDNNGLRRSFPFSCDWTTPIGPFLAWISKGWCPSDENLISGHLLFRGIGRSLLNTLHSECTPYSVGRCTHCRTRWTSTRMSSSDFSSGASNKAWPLAHLTGSPGSPNKARSRFLPAPIWAWIGTQGACP